MRALLIILLISTVHVNAQWNLKWQSSTQNSNYASGWFNFEYHDALSGFRFYIVDEEAFYVMKNEYSTEAEYVYRFNTAEKFAGNLIYSLGYDLTGDDYVEFYVLEMFGNAYPYRQSMKIIDIVTGATLLYLNDSDYYFTSPVVWEADADGILECSLARYNYPDFNNYIYLVYNTGVPVKANYFKNTQPQFELKQNYPNPFNPSTQINFELNKPGEVSIRIYDSKGELVKTLADKYYGTGSHSLIWNGTNENGVRAASGPYFYQINSNDRNAAKKMMLIK